MSSTDPFEYPPVRLMKPDDKPNGETRNESLAQQWIEAWSQKRDAEARMTELRKEIEKLLEVAPQYGIEIRLPKH